MDTVSLLQKYDIKPSVIRIMIYDFLKNTKSHPTVDDIYQHIISQAPTLSRTTVYNSVKLFSEKGLLKVLSIDGNQLRYDADTGFHGHFLCENCRAVFDFYPDKSIEPDLDGFVIETKEVFYSGRCKACLKN